MVENKTALKQVIIFTDGACIGNPGPGGYGVVLKYGKYRKDLSGGFRLTTSNRMEMMASIVGLEALKEKCAVTIYSDSQLLVDGISKGWVHKWRKKGWKRGKKRALNADLWKRLLELCDQHEVQFVWVRGHTGEPGNERAHDLSMQAAYGSSLAIDKAYEEGKTQINPPTLFSLRKAETGRQDVSIELDGRNYVWTGSNWYEAETFLEPPKVVVWHLNRLLAKELEQEDANISDVYILLERASKAREALQHHRAEKLARQCLKLAPGSQAALAVLCAALRAKGQPQEALEETNEYGGTTNMPLLTSRAAALCDLRRWEEAKRTIGRALAIGKSEKAFDVVRRIKAARPDLYGG
jgi:ribonuclease HI